MDDFKKYLLEEFKQSTDRMKKIDDIYLNLIKFYFTTVFSLITVAIALINYKIYERTDVLITWFLLLPLLFFGIVVFITLQRLMSEYEYLEHVKNQVGEFFRFGSIKNDYKLLYSPFKPFYSLISWMIIFNFIFLLYRAFPFLKNISSTLYVILIFAAFILLLTIIAIVSLNKARLKARDAKRLADIRTMQSALELFYSDKNEYPNAKHWNDLYDYLVNNNSYINKMPYDPLNRDEFVYKYEPDNKNNYKISFKLEENKKKYIANPRGIIDA